MISRAFADRNRTRVLLFMIVLITIPVLAAEIDEFFVGDGPSGITLGQDGAMWFIEEWSNAIGRVTFDGAYTQFPALSNDAFAGSVIRLIVDGATLLAADFESGDLSGWSAVVQCTVVIRSPAQLVAGGAARFLSLGVLSH